MQEYVSLAHCGNSDPKHMPGPWCLHFPAPPLLEVCLMMDVSERPGRFCRPLGAMRFCLGNAASLWSSAVMWTRKGCGRACGAGAEGGQDSQGFSRSMMNGSDSFYFHLEFEKYPGNCVHNYNQKKGCIIQSMPMFELIGTQ